MATRFLMGNGKTVFNIGEEKTSFVVQDRKTVFNVVEGKTILKISDGRKTSFYIKDRKTKLSIFPERKTILKVNSELKSFTDLTDIKTEQLEDKQILQYNSDIGIWENKNALDDKEDNLTFSTGLDNSNQTITTKDSEIDHNSLNNYSEDEHRKIDDSATGNTDLWSAEKINTELSGKQDTGNYIEEDDNISLLTNDEGYITDYSVTENDVTQHESAIDHDALTNFESNEHIDWTVSQTENIHSDNYTDTDTTYSFNSPLSETDEEVSIPKADSETDGYLSSTDWNTFNDKADSDTTYTAGTGLELDGTEFNNTDTGSSAVSTHESDYNHDNFLTNIESESIDDLNDVDTSGLSDDDILAYNSTSGNFEANKISIQNFKNSKIYISEDNDAYFIWNNGNIELYKNGELVQRW